MERKNLLRRTISKIMLAMLLVSTIVFTTDNLMKESAASDGGSVDSWSMFRHDANHTGYSSSTVSSLALFRNYTMTQGMIKSSPALTDDAIYVCSLDGYAYKYNATPPYAAMRLWQSSNRYGSICSSPFVTPDTVYFGSDDGHIVALYTSDGSERWIYPQIGTIGAVKSSPVVVDDILYVGSSDGYLYALNATTGSECWRFWVFYPVESSPAVSGNAIFFGSNGSISSRIYALEKNTGRIKWFNQTGGDIVSSPTVVGNKVFVGSCDSRVYAFDVSTGNRIWDNRTWGPVVSSPAVAYNKVFIGSNDGNVSAFNAETGDWIWNFTTKGSVTSSPAVTADGKVVIGSNDGNIYLLDASTGANISEYEIGQPIDRSSPAVANGLVAIGSDDRCIRLFGRNRPPVAAFVCSPQQPIVTQQVTFISQCSDPDGLQDIIQYGWNFGDGTPSINTTQPRFYHTYSAARSYNVTLIAWDKQWVSNSTWQLVNVTEAWPMFHHDATLSGHSTSLAPVSNLMPWSPRQIGSDVSGADAHMYPSPCVVGDTVFMASFNSTSSKGAVYAFYTDGTLMWSNTTLPNKIHSSPAFVNGSVYVGCDNGYVYNFSATTGEAGQALNVSSPYYGVLSSPTVSGNKIFVGSDSGYVYSIDLGTGSKVTSEWLGGIIYSSPSVANNTVFIGSTNGTIYALNEANLRKINQAQTSGSIVSSPTVAENSVFIGSDDSKIYAFDAGTLNQKWSHPFKTDGAVKSSPAFFNGTLYVGSTDGNLYAINATTGAELWRSNVGAVGWSSPAVADGKVFIGAENKICALSITENGSEVWSYQTSGLVESSPAILNDALYVGSQDGYLYAFHREMHDVAILNVTAVPTIVAQGETVGINVTLKNQGDFNETNVTIIVSYDSTTIGNRSLDLTREDPTQQRSFSWNTSGIDPETYTISANVTLAIDDNLTNNWMEGGQVTIRPAAHDVAVTNVYTCKDGCDPVPVVGKSYSVCVNVTVENRGDYQERINITVYANMTAFDSKNVTIPAQSTMLANFRWNTTDFVLGNYNITAKAWPVLGEDNTENNEFTDPSTNVMAIIGDVNNSTIVDIADVYRVAHNYGKDPYDVNCDIDNNHMVDIIDYYIVCKHYGHTLDNDPF